MAELVDAFVSKTNYIKILVHVQVVLLRFKNIYVFFYEGRKDKNYIFFYKVIIKDKNYIFFLYKVIIKDKNYIYLFIK
jgi:hypothetical protein